jgi:hypothetical protein
VNGLRRAVFLLAVGLVLQSVLPRTEHLIRERFTVLATTRLVVDGPDEGGYCSSPYLPYALRRWTLGPLYVGDQPHEGRMDFRIACRSEKGAARLTVTGARGERVTELSAPQGRHPAVAALELADALSEDPAFIRSATELHRYDAQSAAHAAAEQWKAGEWRRAAGNFFFALEADVNPTVMYYGLYESHAKLGDLPKAYWYLLCHLKTGGRTPQSLEARQLEALKGISAAQILRSMTPGPLPRVEALFALREGRVNRIADMLRENAMEYPWDERYPRALAGVYERLGWTDLARSWTRRAELVSAVNGSIDVQSALLAARLAR